MLKKPENIFFSGFFYARNSVRTARNGFDKKFPRISELNAEDAMLSEWKKSPYAEYRKTKSEMQDWLVAQKIVQEILKEDEQKKALLAEEWF